MAPLDEVWAIMKLAATLKPLPTLWLDEVLARKVAYDRAGLFMNRAFDQHAVIYEKVRRQLFPDRIKEGLSLPHAPAIARHPQR